MATPRRHSKDDVVEMPRIVASDPAQGDIASRAYQLFQARGGEHGSDWEDWLQAERELRAAGGSVGTA